MKEIGIEHTKKQDPRVICPKRFFKEAVIDLLIENLTLRNLRYNIYPNMQG